MKSLSKNLAIRFLFAILSLIFISLVTFLADEIAPGDQATVAAGEKASVETVNRLREQMGLNRPWPVRYGEYVSNALRGDFGRSSTGSKEPVADIVKRTLPLTGILAFSATVVAAVFGIVFGIIAALKENRWPDRSLMLISTLGVTIPTFVLGPLFVQLFALKMDVLPAYYNDTPEGLLLPVIILALRPMAQITRLMRSTMLDVMGMDYIRLAVAKGVPPFRLITKHALRNAILPVITAIGNNFGILLTGSFIIETFFGIPGLGSTAIIAIQAGNSTVIQITTLIAGGMFVLINLLVDLLNPFIDPRIREAMA